VTSMKGRRLPIPPRFDLRIFLSCLLNKICILVSQRFDSGGSGGGAQSGSGQGLHGFLVVFVIYYSCRFFISFFPPDDRKKYALELLKLRDMGFGDEDSNLQALRQTGGDLNSAVNIIVKLPSSGRQSAPTTAPVAAARGAERGQAALLASLYNFGFKDERKNIEALRQSNNNLDQAVNLLVKQAVTNGMETLYCYYYHV